MAVPLLVQMEQEIDLELEADAKQQEKKDLNESTEELVPSPQVITNDLKNLHERVRQSRIMATAFLRGLAVNCIDISKSCLQR